MTTAASTVSQQTPPARCRDRELTYLGPDRDGKCHGGRSHDEIIIPPHGPAEAIRAGEHAAAEGDHGDGEEAPIYGPVLVAIIASRLSTCRLDDLFRLWSRAVSFVGVGAEGAGNSLSSSDMVQLERAQDADFFNNWLWFWQMHGRSEDEQVELLTADSKHDT